MGPAFFLKLSFELPSDRSCPGKYFANRVLFLNIACTLAVFNIEAPAGEKLEARFEDGLLR